MPCNNIQSCTTFGYTVPVLRLLVEYFKNRFVSNSLDTEELLSPWVSFTPQNRSTLACKLV